MLAPVENKANPAAPSPPAPATARSGRSDGVSRYRLGWSGLGLAALLLAVLAIGGVGAWQLWSGGGAASEPYVTATVQRGDIEDVTTALGIVQPLEFVDVGTQVSGQLRKIYVDVGASVARGDLLAEIDPTVHLARVEADKAQLMNLEAQLADRQAQLVLAQQQFQRQSNLMKADATSKDAVQSARATLASAAAQVEALKAQIQNTESVLKGDEANLGYTKIHAPMSGTVVSQTARQGQTLNANQQAPIILRIADLSTMTVWTQVSEADIGRLRIGMDVYFTTLGQPERRWRSTLRKILPTPEVVNNVVLYNALFDVPNPTGALLPQMTAQVFFVSAAAKDALLVPVAALQRPVRRDARPGLRDGMARDERPPSARYQVRVLGEDGNPAVRVVRVGIVNRVSAQILEGLREGDRVVIGTQGPAASQPDRGSSRRRARLS